MLKRTGPIQRKTPMPRPAKPMAKRSKKRRRADGGAEMDARREWGRKFAGCCWICWRPGAIDIHEIASKGQASDWRHVENYFAVCRRCHDEILSWLPEPVQIAFKEIEDEEHLDIGLICRLRSRAETAITAEEVRAWKQFINVLRGIQ